MPATTGTENCCVMCRALLVEVIQPDILIVSTTFFGGCPKQRNKGSSPMRILQETPVNALRRILDQKLDVYDNDVGQMQRMHHAQPDLSY